jgi:hypothetical protein
MFVPQAARQDVFPLAHRVSGRAAEAFSFAYGGKTSDEYWRGVARDVGDAPSSLQLIFPEAYLGTADAPARIARIQQTMRGYLADGLLDEREGAVYVERSVGGRIRRGLMLELDLEQYDFSRESTSPIRPTEGTMVERLAPRIAVRSGAELELPHILVLIDDPACTVIEPLGAERETLAKLYETDLMRAGGRVAGYAVAMWGRGSSAAAGALARYRERALAQERIREVRLAEANRQAGTRPPQRHPSPGRPRPQRPRQPSPAKSGDGEGAS